MPDPEVTSAAPPVTPAPAVETTPQGSLPPAAPDVQTPAGATGPEPPATAAPAGTQPGAVVEVPPTPPAVSPELQQYVASLEQESSEARTQEDLRSLQEKVIEYSQRLQADHGMTPEQADYIARREGQQALREYRDALFRQGQINAAFDIGQRMGVDPRILINLPTPAAMVQAVQRAKARTATQSEVAALRAENEALKKKLAPAQTFASGAPAPAPGSGNYLEALKGKGPLPSAAEIDKWTAQHMAGRQG